MKNKKTDDNGWGRNQVTIRLVKWRLERMKELARGLDDGLTPTDLLDWALTEAARDRSQPLEVTYALNDLTEAMGRIDRLLDMDLGRLTSLLASNAAAMADLTKAIASATPFSDRGNAAPGVPSPDGAPLPSVAEWLAKEFPPQCSKIKAIASWLTKERSGPAAAHMGFSFEVLSVDGKPVSHSKSYGHAARLDAIKTGSAFDRLDLHSRALFSFEKNDAGAWNIQAHLCDKDRKEMGLIGTHRV